ncbi:MAG TPA: MBL fold metallo-hydrolase [Candidatus Paceibacterota bacterium]
MILTYHEGGCIRASAGDTTIVFGPVSKASKNFKPTNFGADIAFISLNDSDMNGANEASRGDKNPFIVAGPGEYEVSGIAIAGFATKSNYGLEQRINTAYALTFDGISLLYLGAIDETTLPPELSEMDEPDIVFVPISADGVLSPSDANKLCVNLEAKLVIPIFYDDKSLKQFLKEAGEEKPEKMEKLTLKPRDLVGKEGDVVVLTA